LMLFYGLTTILLLGHLRDSFKKIMITVCVAILLIYTNADRYDKDVNNCQWEDLYKIADSPDETVEIYGWCNLLSWERINDPVMSESNAEMLKIWNITDKKKLFYHAPD